jgi:hypothetical protein
LRWTLCKKLKKIKKKKNHNSEAQYGVAILFGLLAIILRLITGFTFYVAPVAVCFFEAYFITCLQDGGFSPSKNPEQEGFAFKPFLTIKTEQPWD